MKTPQIAILGAGPVGLEAALAAAEKGLAFRLYETAPHVGGNIRQWGHVRLFTPWEMSVSPRMRRHLEMAGVEAPGGSDCPTGDELADRLLVPLQSVVKRSEVVAVYVVDYKGEIEFRQVRTGIIKGDQVEIVSGLDSGEQVAIDPVQAGIQLKAMWAQ